MRHFNSLLGASSPFPIFSLSQPQKKHWEARPWKGTQQQEEEELEEQEEQEQEQEQEQQEQVGDCNLFLCPTSLYPWILGSFDQWLNFWIFVVSLKKNLGVREHALVAKDMFLNLLRLNQGMDNLTTLL